MTSVRFGSQNELAGSVEKHGKHKSKRIANAKVTENPTRPPELPNTPFPVSGCNQPAEVRERVRIKYRGVDGARWGSS